MEKPLYVLIMAGGEGTRFYPVSTPERPKQFLSFFGGRTFIQQTYDRILPIAHPARIIVATNSRYTKLVRSQLPAILSSNIIPEPFKKNTAPSIAYAARMIIEAEEDAVMLVLPSDHLIEKEEEFRKVIERAIYVASEREVLVTLGIRPTWPADCYGYLRLGKMIEDDVEGRHAYIVDAFVEKPSVAVAEGYLKDGNYLWNSGMFVWQAHFILSEIKNHLPSLYALADKYVPKKRIKKFFEEAESISIDYGVMERSDRVVTLPCDIGWHDVGTWEGLYNIVQKGNFKLDPRVEEAMRAQLRL